jgi:F0F1-type ATP synthase membrane subunit b/b'
MKLRTALAAGAAIVFYATPALCAEGGEARGSWATLLLYVINFAIFAWIVYYFGAAYIRSFFADRATSIRSTLSRADRAFKEAQELANQAAARMAKLEDEKKRIAAEFDQETAYQVRRIAEAAREGAERIRHDAELTASALTDSSRRRMRERLAASAAGLARDLIERNFEAADQGRLVQGFVERMRRGEEN